MEKKVSSSNIQYSFHSFPLKQTCFQGPQVENLIPTGFNVILLGIKESGIQKQNKK